MTHEGKTVGAGARRVDGRAKVTGQARYAAEFSQPDLLFGWVVSSAITRGRIVRIDASAALSFPGVVQVLSHENRLSLPWFDRSYRDDDAPPGSPLRFLYDAEIVHADQPIALVVADTLETARHAASLVRVEYESAQHQTDLRLALSAAHEPRKTKLGYERPPKPRGDADAALARAEVSVSAEYGAPVEHHHPLEMHASTVIHEQDGSLSIHDKTQGVQNSQRYVCKVFGLASDKVRVYSPFVGGAFGSGLRPQYQLYLAVMAALALKRSVRVVLTRRQMFSFGHRPETLQKVALGANRDGKLTALIHEAVSETSRFEDYMEVLVNWSTLLYPCENTRQAHRLAALDVFTPLDMRAPGAAYGLYAIECAMDELAHALDMDPVELRRVNYADHDHNSDKPFSSKELLACYRQGAARFGWERRNPKPCSMRDGPLRVGWGMATGVWDAMQAPARARATYSAAGKLTVCSATADIGTGTYTVMTQIAADVLGLPLERVSFELGDSTQPFSPFEGGSMTVASVGSAVQKACQELRARLFVLAQELDGSPLKDRSLDEVSFADGFVASKARPELRVALADAMRHADVQKVEEEATSVPNVAKQQSYARNTHSAVFVEVKVDEEIARVQVTRVVSAVAAGRIMNPRTARSQIEGAVVWGIGMALHEATHMDHTLGRYVNTTLSEYHIPVHADIHEIDVIFVPEEDEIVNPLGAKGVGEIGIIGVAAAVANAIYHATGKRIRELPITPDKLLGTP